MVLDNVFVIQLDLAVEHKLKFKNKKNLNFFLNIKTIVTERFTLIIFVSYYVFVLKTKSIV
jgi:hypothetical protein